MIDFAICVMGDFSLERGPVIGDFAICFLRDAVGEMTYLKAGTKQNFQSLLREKQIFVNYCVYGLRWLTPAYFMTNCLLCLQKLLINLS